MLSLLLSLVPGVSDAAALERALASVRPENICADVRFIASDELEGRDTPSHGQRLAARYLRARLERLGLEPMGDDGFFDRYALHTIALDREQSALTLTRGAEQRELAFGQDYFFFGSGVTELDVSGPVLCVGLGAEGDYAGLALAGRWALATASKGVDWRERGRQAQQAGALGLITVPDPEEKEEEPWWSGMPARRSTVEGSDEVGPALPSLWLSRAGALALLGPGAAPARGTDLGVVLRDRRVLGAAQDESLENVCGFWPGSDAQLGQEVLILSAHYDHVGKRNGVVYNGADDNGSGTCGLLAVAEALKHYGPMRRSVLLLWVSGEEKGLWGSAAWSRKPTLTAGRRAVVDINIDMIGRNAPDKLLITPSRALPAYNGLTRLAESLGTLEGFPELGSADEFWKRSDQVNFSENLHIPVAFLFSGLHEDYHQPTDDAEKIDCDKIRRVVRLVVRMLDGLQSDPLAL